MCSSENATVMRGRGGGEVGGVKIPLRLSIVQVILLSCVFAAHRMRRGQPAQLVPVRAA